MYNNFFGFRERPFKLTPDPAYLFLGKSHEEAIAHLIYAISQGEGFVEIIGEAGTGKTTLCRALIERLENEIEVAYIFNPKLDSVQLLKAVNDELGIDAGADTVKDLIDALNAFLLQKKAEGKKVILLIDEAQNLTKEVIEQVRLLSNLETATDKLLQIILAGQPELADMLDSYELRQLRQRITLSCWLKPLTRKETAAYIRHRIGIASQKPGVKFSWAATDAIFRYSQGIPRLINIAADRTLLVAYGLNQHKSGRRTAAAALRELRGPQNRARGRRRTDSRPGWVLLLLAVLLLFIIYHFKLFDPTDPARPRDSAGQASSSSAEAGRVVAKGPLQSPGTAKAAPAPAATVEVAPDAKTPARPETDLPADPVAQGDALPLFLTRLDAVWSRHAAAETVLKLWGIEAAAAAPAVSMPDKNFLEAVAADNDLALLSLPQDLDLIRKLDLPTILTCSVPDNGLPRFVVLSSIDADKATLLGGTAENAIAVAPDALKPFCSGSGYVFWKNFRGLVDSGRAGLSKDSIVSLKLMLLDMGYDAIQISPDYDAATVRAVKTIQEKQGLKVDGIVGPRTKIALYSQMKSYPIPHIVR